MIGSVEGLEHNSASGSTIFIASRNTSCARAKASRTAGSTGGFAGKPSTATRSPFGSSGRTRESPGGGAIDEGSLGSAPASVATTSAQSSAERAIGPSLSSV